MNKKRGIFTSREQSVPIFQYRVAGETYWVDLPWFVTSFYEAYAFVNGKGYTSRSTYRKIESCREGTR